MLKSLAVPPSGTFHHAAALAALDLRIVVPADTGEMIVWEMIVAPDAGPPLHVHSAEDETIHVLAGLFRVTIGERTILASPGATFFLPRGIPHTFTNIGETPGRILCMAPPGGFEALHSELERCGATEPAEIAAIAEKYRIELLPPPPAWRDSGEDALSG